MEITARAPGKIILTGEHAVVHGTSAVAASVDLYTQVSLKISNATESDDGVLKLYLKDMGLEFSWSIGRIKEVFPDCCNSISSVPRSCSSECIKLIASLVEEQNIPEAKIGLAAGISTFIWLYTSIHGCKPGIAVITSNLPLGSGLGSSASFCVSLSATLIALSDAVTLDRSQRGWFSFTEEQLELVNKWAFEGEKIIHGKPSGIDNTVSTFGNMILFKSGKLTLIKSSMPLRMLITNTKVGRNTKALVAGVSERILRHPDAMNAVFTAVDSISTELSSIIQLPPSDELSLTEKEGKIEELMEMNQGLLQCMGVSHTSIETVLRTTLKYKLASKLTGAGGGGCVLTLLPALLAKTVIDKVITELEACGFQCLITEIGGNGVQICSDSSIDVLTAALDQSMERDIVIKEQELRETPVEESVDTGERIPTVGMLFDSIDEAYNFYNAYGWLTGFSIRINTTLFSRKDKTILKRTMCCSKEGTRRKHSRMATPKNPRPITRVGCKACYVVRLQEDGKYKLIEFVENHNHELVKPSQVQKTNPKRGITRSKAAFIKNMYKSGV